MPDNRSTEVQRFRKEQGATRLHLLTVNSPFGPSQDRYVLTELPHETYLFECAKCSPRVSLGYGQLHTVSPETLRAFLNAVSEAEDAWTQIEPDGTPAAESASSRESAPSREGAPSRNGAPVGLHDGLTITVEVADSAGYRRARIIDPAPDSPQARLLNAWLLAFPQVRRALQ